MLPGSMAPSNMAIIELFYIKLHESSFLRVNTYDFTIDLPTFAKYLLYFAHYRTYSLCKTVWEYIYLHYDFVIFVQKWTTE